MEEVKKYQLCYRLEHKESGLGPYEHSTQYLSVIKALNKHTDPDKFPRELSKHTKNHFFGWNSLEKLSEFTKSELEGSLVRYRFHKVVYLVPDEDVVTYPDGQVSFLRKSAVIIDTIEYLTKKQKRAIKDN